MNRVRRLLTARNLVLAALALLYAGALLAECLHGQEHAVASEATAHHYVILVHVDEKRLYLLENGELVQSFPIATGKPGFASPIGDWEITSKGIKKGKSFGARWLGLNVPWGVYGIHGTNAEGKIGAAVSHGCIRMRNRDIRKLYDMVSVGTPVIVRNGPYGPFGTGFKTISPGERGADVKAVQQRLSELGYFYGWASGIYDYDLTLALKRFQQDAGLTVEDKITRDDLIKMGFLEFE